jgi:proteic killer suppression protein
MAQLPESTPNTPSGFVLSWAGSNVAVAPRDMALPGLQLHALKGDRRDSWAVSVSGNWRVTFKFSGSDIKDVDYEDYH